MLKWFILFTLVIGRLSSQQSPRAINSTGLWSKYNLVVKPNLSLPVTTAKTTTASSVIESKYATLEIPDVEDDDEDEEEDDDDDDDDSAEDDVEEVVKDEEAEDYEVEDADAGHSTVNKYTHNKHRPHSHRPVHVSDSATTTQRSQKIPSSHLKKAKKKGKSHKKIKGLKKLKKYMLPLLLAYKLKFFTLVPLLLGGLVLMVATTGFAGFFFALFAVGVGLKKD
ncbi:nucleoplasmin-like protein ANO39 isoform X1 [Cimex lectularius]|uniref:Uncharacterized protein n=1 Tax=Cimex lectularius TaxID=79782 RepID=A0A8I6S6I6_CIMLE|nr:nucleoplasmin-like protein ANO39 isoform X1 [Cimex lectularius]